MGLFKPDWQNNDPNKRKEAINKLNKQSILKEIALNDKVAYLRRMALEKIGDDDEFFYGSYAVARSRMATISLIEKNRVIVNTP